jgi:tetratricopeptide (TPR) repeat protein
LSAKALYEGNLDEAIKHCRIALLGDPDNMNAYLNMAIGLFRKDQLDVSELVCNSALRIDRNNAPILNLLGLIHLKKDDVKGAITMFQASVTADPKFLDARKNLAAVTLNFKDFRTASSQLQEVLKLAPDNVDYKLSYAVALRGMENYDEARKVLEGLLLKDSQNGQVRYNLCILLHEYIQTYDEALQVCNRFRESIGKKHPKYKEMKLRVKGISETIKVMEEMKKLQESTPPEGAEPTPAEGDVKKPEGEVKKPEGEAKKPEGEAKKPEGEAKKPEGEVKKPEGEVKKPEGEAKKPEGKKVPAGEKK